MSLNITATYLSRSVRAVWGHWADDPKDISKKRRDKTSWHWRVWNRLSLQRLLSLVNLTWLPRRVSHLTIIDFGLSLQQHRGFKLSSIIYRVWRRHIYPKPVVPNLQRSGVDMYIFDLFQDNRRGGKGEFLIIFTYQVESRVNNVGKLWPLVCIVSKVYRPK